MILFLFVLLCFCLIIQPLYCNSLKRAREQHRSVLSTNNDIRQLATLSNPKYINKVLDNILIPRVVGTENHEKVFGYIKNELERLKWHVDVDEFVEKAPIFGNLQFKNIMATPNPQAHRFLVLACHYDSKYFKDEVFVGAVDSAAPCAMMLEIAKTLSKQLEANNNTNLSLKLIFFDGEEAFEKWGPHDSIYGAKHLAERLHNTKSVINGETVTELDKIDILILLHLLGASNPYILHFFDNTEKWFRRLAQIEQDLLQMNLLKNRGVVNYFQLARDDQPVEDDYTPFLERNVPILPLITGPLPIEWHTSYDDRDLIDMDAVTNLNLILKVFISEYLHLLALGKG